MIKVPFRSPQPSLHHPLYQLNVWSSIQCLKSIVTDNFFLWSCSLFVRTSCSHPCTQTMNYSLQNTQCSTLQVSLLYWPVLFHVLTEFNILLLYNSNSLKLKILSPSQKHAAWSKCPSTINSRSSSFNNWVDVLPSFTILPNNKH